MEKAKKTRKELAWYYCAFIFTMLPLFFMDMYFNIAEEKWLLFTLSSVIFISVSLLLWLYEWTKRKEPAAGPVFSYYDYVLWAFLAANLISLTLSYNTKESITGVASRHHGFLNILLYVLLIFIIKSGFTEYKKLCMILALIGGLVSLTAVCQYLSFDPIGMYKGVTVVSVHRMISTIGNMNIFAGYLNIVTPLTFLWFIKATEKRDRIISGICLGLNAAAGVASTSDGFYLGTTVSIILLLILGVLKFSELRRVPLALSVCAFSDYALLTAADYIRKHNIIFSSSLKKSGISIRPSSGFTKVLEKNSMLLLILAVVMLLAYLGLGLLKNKDEDALLPKVKLSNILLCIFLALIGVFAVLAVLSYPFDEKMGSFRGFIWNLAIKDFAESDIFTKLFGYGQETILAIYRLRYRDLMVNTTGVIYDNVHCEPLQYLVTTGFVGLAAYLTLVFSVIGGIIKRVRNNTGLRLLLVPIVSYFTQSFVNIAQSATTPVYFILMGLALGSISEKEDTQPS